MLPCTRKLAFYVRLRASLRKRYGTTVKGMNGLIKQQRNGYQTSDKWWQMTTAFRLESLYYTTYGLLNAIWHWRVFMLNEAVKSRSR